MGQHKYNATAIAAKNGELPPKPKGMSKMERRRMLSRMIYDEIGLSSVLRALDINPYDEADKMADLLYKNR